LGGRGGKGGGKKKPTERLRPAEGKKKGYTPSWTDELESGEGGKEKKRGKRWSLILVVRRRGEGGAKKGIERVAPVNSQGRERGGEEN